MLLNDLLPLVQRPDMVRTNERRPFELKIKVLRPHSIGGTPCVDIERMDVGFDWDQGKLILTPVQALTTLSPEDIEAIRKSVSMGQSWHAYEGHKATVAKHDAVLQWLADEGAVIKNLLTQEGVRYTVAWPELGEEMTDYFHSPTMAVQRAMLLAKQKDAPT